MIAEQSVTTQRLLESLRHSMGPVILDAMTDKTVVEVMVNPDGRIWIDVAGEGLKWTGQHMAPHDAESILRTLATHAGLIVTKDQPRVSATLPETGERFQGEFPPLVSAAAFAIRKRPEMIFSLESYVDRGTMTADQCAIIRQAVDDHANIVVAGGTGSGKTTLLNAILAEPSFADDRVIIIEDTRELQCSAVNCVQLLTKKGELPVTMADLVFDVLRLRPDRIIGGEVRDGQTALNLLKAWNTGHPGGATSIHANNAYEALTRIEDLIGEVSARIPYRAIAQAINVVVYIERSRTGRKVKDVIRVRSHDGDAYQLEQMASAA
ncbi:MAG: P-type conjugative transfer ATPase TrbB [Caulobacteraceae bacterium]